jgi:hypothetical protein
MMSSKGLCFCRAVCRKHELTQFELEMVALDLAYKKQQKEELVTGVSCYIQYQSKVWTPTHSRVFLSLFFYIVE